MRFAIGACVLLLAVLSSSPVAAQLRQYTPPGGAEPEREIDEQAVEEEMAEARWRFGPVRVAPVLGIENLSWTDDAFDERGSAGGPGQEVSDLTATLVAGATAWLPTGSHVFWTARAIPSYVWWRDLDGRNQATGRYGAGVFGFFNRLTLRAAAERTEGQRLQTLEALELAVSRNDRLTAGAALRLSGAIGLFARGSVTEVESQQPDDGDPRSARFDRLDREERFAAVGLAWQPRERVRVGLGVERAEIEFHPGARDLSAEDTAPILEVSLGGDDADLALDLRLALRSLEPTGESQFAGFDEPAGELYLTFRPGWRIEVGLFTERLPVFALDQEWSHFIEDRAGAGVAVRLGQRASWRIYGDVGDLEFVGLAPGARAREDELTVYGTSLTWQPSPRVGLAFELGWESFEIDSSLPGFDRETTRLRSGIQLGLDSLLWR